MSKNKYIPTFGVEIHVELLTKTKAFSPSEIDFNASPNTMIHPIDLGYPGTKPRVNKKMVEYAFRLAKVLQMEISETILFDRKNYFYPDLPKGYQITQHFQPIGEKGFFTIFLNGKKKKIAVTEIHMEEDTAKQTITNEGVLLDFNRAGVPLIEIVSGHEDFENIDEVIQYVKQLREQLIIMGLTNGKLEEGSLRVDVNVSVRKDSDKDYGNKVEIKNLNSFKNIRKALEYEINRQQNLLEKNKKVLSTTGNYNESIGEVVFMRKKSTHRDYNFIPEGNISPIRLGEDFKKECDSYNDVLLIDFINKWNKKINENEFSIILSNKKLFDLFNELVVKNDLKEIINFITNEIKSSMNEYKKDLSQIRFDSKEIETILKLRKDGKIDTKKISALLLEMFDKSIESKLKEISGKKLLTNKEIEKIVDSLIKENKELIEKEKDRKERIEKLIMGKLMKETKGQANPKTSIEIIRKKIWA